MKKLTAFAAVLALVSAGALAYADSPKAGTPGTVGTWTGWITDETCGAKNANAEGKACALKCAKAGAKLVLYVNGDKKLVGLDNQDEAMKHVGTPVSVTGTLENGVIKVEKIEESKG